MKRFYHNFFFLFSLSVLLLCGCQKEEDLTPPPGTTDDSTTEESPGSPAEDNSDYITVNHWIDDIMRDKYLWYEDIPERSSLDYGSHPFQFFESLLSEQERGEREGYYSTIEQLVTSPRSINSVTLDYGMEYILYELPGTSYYVARIIYVLPNSPAQEAGIKRGDWVIASNGTPITANNHTQLLSSGSTAVLSTMTYDPDTDLFDSGPDIRISAARAIENNPIFLDTIYTYNSQKIGYLVYNSFVTGKNGYDDKSYLTEMVKCFERFKTQNVNQFILDLRYNGGGYIDCSQWLGTGLAPASSLDKTFAYMLSNDKQENRKEELLFIPEATSGNLDLSQLYVITSSFTASASETVINSLRAYMNVTLIGTTTEGKNVGGYIYENIPLGYAITPITFRVYNSLDQSDFSHGFVPDHVIDEMDSMEPFYNLGDTRETLLAKAISLITGTAAPAGVNVKSASHSMSVKISPLHSLSKYGNYGKLLKKEE